MIERGVILAEEGELLDLHHLFSIENALSTASMLGLSRLGTLTTDSEEEPSAAALSASATTTGSIDDFATEMVRQGRSSLPAIEDALVRAAVKQAEGNIARAATLLGVTRAQVDYRVKKLGD